MYAGVVAMAGAVGVLVLGLYALHRLTAVAPDSLDVLPFESGWAPEQHALSRYHVRWYLATLLFPFSRDARNQASGLGHLMHFVLANPQCWNKLSKYNRNSKQKPEQRTLAIYNSILTQAASYRAPTSGNAPKTRRRPRHTSSYPKPARSTVTSKDMKPAPRPKMYVCQCMGNRRISTIPPSPKQSVTKN